MNRQDLELAYGKAVATLRKWGIHESLVNFRPVELLDGHLIYRVPHVFGATTRWAAFPILQARRRMDALIGFVFEDGTIRNDAEILCHGTAFDIPMLVCFYKNCVPVSRRRFPNRGLAPIVQRPRIIR